MSILSVCLADDSKMGSFAAAVGFLCLFGCLLHQMAPSYPSRHSIVVRRALPSRGKIPIGLGLFVFVDLRVENVVLSDRAQN